MHILRPYIDPRYHTFYTTMDTAISRLTSVSPSCHPQEEERFNKATESGDIKNVILAPHEDKTGKIDYFNWEGEIEGCVFCFLLIIG